MYWKVLNDQKLHHGFQWKAGLNVLERPFNNDVLQECVPDRLYYCTQEQIHNWLYLGNHIQRIYEPTDDPLFQSVSFRDKKGANRMILDSRVWSLSDSKTFEMLGLRMTDFDHLFYKAYQNENIEFLDTWVTEYMKDTGVPFECSEQLMCEAFTRGHINILNWWLEQKQKHGIKLYVSHYVVGEACANGHVVVLDWWMNAFQKGNIPSLAYSESVMNYASKHANFNVLDWWMQRYLNKDIPELKYSSKSMDWADVMGHIQVLDWWLDQHKKHGLPLKYSNIGHYTAWWKENAAQLPPSSV